MLFGLQMFITVFAKSMTAEMRGVLQREDLGDKTYTNLVYSMQTLGLCAYVPGADAIDYNLTPLFREMSIGPLVKRMLARKLATTGWKEPGPNDPFTRTFYEQCFHFGFHHTLGISERPFQDWLAGQSVEVEAPPVLEVAERHGERECQPARCSCGEAVRHHCRHDGDWKNTNYTLMYQSALFSRHRAGLQPCLCPRRGWMDR